MLTSFLPPAINQLMKYDFQTASFPCGVRGHKTILSTPSEYLGHYVLKTAIRPARKLIPSD
jgi:hypothetical protein